MLGKDRVDALSRLIRMLRRVEEIPLGPEGLDATHDDTGPDFPGGFDEGDGADIVQVGGV